MKENSQEIYSITKDENGETEDVTHSYTGSGGMALSGEADTIW